MIVMFPGWTVSSVLLLLLPCRLSADQQELRGFPGQSVTLPCKTPTAATVRAAEWSRPDQETLYVFLYRNKQSDPTRQDPSFAKRVELVDSQLKDGNLSLILKDLQSNDAGMYECRVKQETMIRLKRAVLKSDPICSIRLTVLPPGSQLGPYGRNTAGASMVGHVGLLAGALMLMIQGI